jgi:hypothetical protein
MALYKVTVKSSHNSNGIKIEKGMSAEVVCSSSNPIGSDGGSAIQDAFMRKYGIDMKKAHAINPSWLAVEKIN